MPFFPVDPGSKFVISLECLLSETASQLVLRKRVKLLEAEVLAASGQESCVRICFVSSGHFSWFYIDVWSTRRWAWISESSTVSQNYPALVACWVSHFIDIVHFLTGQPGCPGHQSPEGKTQGWGWPAACLLHSYQPQFPDLWDMASNTHYSTQHFWSFLAVQSHPESSCDQKSSW